MAEAMASSASAKVTSLQQEIAVLKVSKDSQDQTFKEQLLVRGRQVEQEKVAHLRDIKSFTEKVKVLKTQCLQEKEESSKKEADLLAQIQEQQVSSRIR